MNDRHYSPPPFPDYLTSLEQLAAIFRAAEAGNPAARTWTLQHFPQVLELQHQAGDDHEAQTPQQPATPHPPPP